MGTINSISLVVGYVTIGLILISMLIVLVDFVYRSRHAFLALFNLFLYNEKAKANLEYEGFRTKKVIGRIWFAWKP